MDPVPYFFYADPKHWFFLSFFYTLIAYYESYYCFSSGNKSLEEEIEGEGAKEVIPERDQGEEVEAVSIFSKEDTAR